MDRLLPRTESVNHITFYSDVAVAVSELDTNISYVDICKQHAVSAMLGGNRINTKEALMSFLTGVAHDLDHQNQLVFWQSVAKTTLDVVDQLLPNLRQPAVRGNPPDQDLGEVDLPHAEGAGSSQEESRSVPSIKNTGVSVTGLSHAEKKIIVESLRLYQKKTPFLYRNERHAFIKCTTKRCKFCTALFENISLTPCEQYGHKPCGVEWFPHVGLHLWKGLRKSHQEGKVFKPKMSKSGTSLLELETTLEYEAKTSEDPVSPSYNPVSPVDTTMEN